MDEPLRPTEVVDRVNAKYDVERAIDEREFGAIALQQRRRRTFGVRLIQHADRRVEADDLARNRIQCRQPPAGAASDLEHAAGVDLSHEFSQRVRDGAGRLRHEPLRS
ncbi:MAG: hypothetical protein QF717_03350 [SAR202 cluster bacterium]|nr:hypothetical protein [SAR202 cluster bacterium]MDP7103115.1 hypothetical protein [SAR202 cluster bacterium]MDP7224520.1 hypothetical protein [SAR202 cluster bacterium]MDP7414095.1 hypothetical protein [SAR202 cluster bacterium]MDP7532304.1 hypothetical protein [SAR202 cluster bacterium]